MQKLLMLFSLTMILGMNAQAAVSKDICATKVDAAINKYFDRYVDLAREQLQEQADENEEELNLDALPGGLTLFESKLVKNKEIYTYSWGENEECACGVDVIGTLSKNGKTCKSAKVDENTQSCDCG